MITASRNPAFLVFIVSSLLLIVNISLIHAGQYNIQVDFAFDNASDPKRQVVGYRLYQEDSAVCKSDSSDQFGVCIKEGGKACRYPTDENDLAEKWSQIFFFGVRSSSPVVV